MVSAFVRPSDSAGVETPWLKPQDSVHEQWADTPQWKESQTLRRAQPLRVVPHQAHLRVSENALYMRVYVAKSIFCLYDLYCRWYSYVLNSSIYRLWLKIFLWITPKCPYESTRVQSMLHFCDLLNTTNGTHHLGGCASSQINVFASPTGSDCIWK